jgi:hypothetical protein
MQHKITLSTDQVALIRGTLQAKLDDILGDLNQGNLSDYSADLLNTAHDDLAAVLLALEPMK